VNYFRFLAWADSGPAQEFMALVPSDTAELADVWISTNPAIHEQPQVSWEMFKKSKVKFSYSSPSGVRLVNAGELPNAVEYFEAACRAIMPKRP
jgi:hypothetical protein